MSNVLLDAANMRRTLGRMAHEILEVHQGSDDLVVLGIMRRGWPVAKRLAFSMTQIEGNTIPVGKLSTSRHRDDRPRAETDESEIPFEINGKTVILVDEVIFTGRTIRAALEELFTHGRPRKVELAVLIDRGHRELPIEPQYVGKAVPTDRGDHIVVKVQEIDGEDVVLLESASHAGVS
jgi:pyrimidine operon attenuation protein/uracil phosphoribosyltransferase